MKVVFITPYPPAPDGVGRYAKNLVENLKASNPSLRVEVLPWNYQNKLRRFVGPIFNRGQMLKTMKEADIVHVQYVASLYLWHLAGILQKAHLLNPQLKIVVTLHETNDNTSPAWFFHRLQDKLLRASDRVIVHTHYHLNLLDNSVQTKTSVVPMAVPAMDLGERLSREAHSLLIPGFINKWKGHDLALEALARLKNKFPDVRLRIVGKAHDRKWLEQLQLKAKDLRVNDIVSFEEGFKSPTDFDAAFQTAGVVLLPYRRIAMSAVLADTIAHLAPTVMSDLAPLREYTRDQGLYFTNGDSVGLADLLTKVWQNPVYISDNTKLFQELKNLYSTSRIVQRVIDIYRELTA